MDRHTEDCEAKKEYFYKEMMLTKSNFLLKLRSYQHDESFLNLLSQLIVYANSEDVKPASEIIDILEMDNIDQLAIMEDLDYFTQEFTSHRENTYAGDNYELE